MAYDPLAELPRLRAGIGKMESGNDYSALGPVINRKTGTDRAYGKYGVMGENIPQWTEQALGRRLTPFEYLHSPEAQERVFEHQMTNNLLKYRSAKDAASIWFSGRPYAEAARAGAHDINMPVSQYVNSVMGGGPQPAGQQYAENQPADWATDWQPSRLAPQNAPKSAVDWAESWAPTRETAAPSAAAPTTGGVEFLEGSKIQPDQRPIVEQPTPIAPTQPVVAPKFVEPAPWGFPEQAANAVVAGYLPEIASKFTGRAPEAYERGKRFYEQEKPFLSSVAEIGGGAAQGLALGLTGVGVLGAVAPRVAQAVPRLRPVVETAQRWLAGQAGRTTPFPSGGTLAQPGLAATAERIAAPVVVGGTAGATNALINQRLRPDVPLGEQVLQGATFGAATQPIAQFAFGRPGPMFTPNIEESVRQNAMLARSKYNIPISPWQVSPYTAEQLVAHRAVPEEAAMRQVKKFGEEVGKTFGHTGAFTDAEVGKALDAIGNVMETTANMISLPTVNRGTAPLAQDLVTLGQEIAANVVDDATRNKLLKIVQTLSDRLLLAPVSGKEIQNLTQKNGFIDKNLNPTTNSLDKYYNARMKDLVYEYFYRADPSSASTWEGLRNAYKNAILGLKIATPSGVPDASKLQSAARKVKAKGNMAELAEIAALIPKVTDKGIGRVAGVGIREQEKPTSHLGTLGLLGLGSSGGMALEHFGPEIMKHAFEGGEIPTMAALGIAGLGAGLYGGKKGYNALINQLLGTPRFQSAILRGQGPALQQQVFVNPLTAGATSGGLTFQERKKRGKK